MIFQHLANALQRWHFALD